MSGVIVLVVDAGASENGLMKPDFGLMIWTWVSFLVLLYILGRFAYRPLMFLVEQREKRIRDSLREAEEAKKKAERVAEEREGILKEAQDQGNEIVENAREAAESQKRRILTEAREESNRIIMQAEEEIGREKRQAFSELSGTVADLAMEAAERIIRRELNREKHIELIDELMDSLERKDD